VSSASIFFSLVFLDDFVFVAGVWLSSLSSSCVWSFNKKKGNVYVLYNKYENTSSGKSTSSSSSSSSSSVSSSSSLPLEKVRLR